MTRELFPFLTIDLLEKQGGLLLSQLAALWPAAAPEIVIINTLLPELNKVQIVRGMLQHAVDWVNGLTGAQPVVTG